MSLSPSQIIRSCPFDAKAQEYLDSQPPKIKFKEARASHYPYCEAALFESAGNVRIIAFRGFKEGSSHVNFATTAVKDWKRNYGPIHHIFGLSLIPEEIKKLMQAPPLHVEAAENQPQKLADSMGEAAETPAPLSNYKWFMLKLASLWDRTTSMIWDRGVSSERASRITGAALDRKTELEGRIAGERGAARSAFNQLTPAVDFSKLWWKDSDGPCTSIAALLNPAISGVAPLDEDALASLIDGMAYYMQENPGYCGWLKEVDTGIVRHTNDLPKLIQIQAAFKNIGDLNTQLFESNLIVTMNQQFHDWQDRTIFPPSNALSQILNEHAYMAKALIQSQHRPYEDAFRSLEYLSFVCGSEKGMKGSQLLFFGSQFIVNLRTLRYRFDQYNELRMQGVTAANALIQIGGSIATIEPTLACLSMSAAIYALIATPDQTELPPLTHQAFMDVMTKGLAPMLQELHDSIKSSQLAAAGQLDEQTTVLLNTLNEFQQELMDRLDAHAQSMHARFNTTEFNTFVGACQDRLSSYRKEVGRVQTFISDQSGFSGSSWIDTYLNETEALILEAQENRANGFKGDASIFNLTEAYKNKCAIFSTGAIYHQLTGSLQFPPQLLYLDSAVYTFIKLNQKFLQKGTILTTEQKNRLTHLSKILKEGVDAQIGLLKQTEHALKNLIDSHGKYMKVLNVQRKRTSENLRRGIQKTVQDYVQSQQGLLTGNKLVGQKMLFWSEFVSQQMNLSSHDDKVENQFYSDESYHLVTSPLVNIWNLLKTKKMSYHPVVNQINNANAYIQKGSPKEVLTNQAKSFTHWPVGIYQNSGFAREIWFDGSFRSNLTVRTLSSIPFLGSNPLSGSISAFSDRTIFVEPSSKPSNPLLDCTLKWNASFYNGNTSDPGDGGALTTTYQPNSFLQESDVKEIPGFSARAMSHRATLMTDVFNALDAIIPTRMNNPLREKFERAGLVIPLSGKGPKLPLPDFFVDSMLHILCPDCEKHMALGTEIELKYSFDKGRDDKYHLTLHASYKSLPFKSQTIFITDRVTVESFRPQKRNASSEEINLDEFLYALLFAGAYPNEGLPNSQTYLNKQKEILAPSISNFPGLFEILEKFPHFCFTFDHCNYDDAARLSLELALRNGKIEHEAKKFFIQPKVEVNPENYASVQRKMRAALKASEDSKEFADFKNKYAVFLTLSTLVADLKPEKVEELLFKHAKIIPPGRLGGFEQSFFYSPPRNQDVQALANTLYENPSLVRKRLEMYRDPLAKLNQYFIDEKDHFFSWDQSRLLASQLEIGRPGVAMTNLEEDIKGVN